jgi:membrane-associated phospholipid phosphatase
MSRAVVVLVFAWVLCTAQTSAAEEHRSLSEEASQNSYSPALDTSYFWDDGAVPFIYGSASLALGLRIFAEPAATPRLFTDDEGGAEVRGDSVHSVLTGLYALTGAGATAAVSTPARWHHFKGYAQALLTTIALTEGSKMFFGRHRPDYVQGDDDPEQRRSFVSGHSSTTASASVYFGLYFHYHLRHRLRGQWAEPGTALVYTLLTAAAVGVPWSRVQDNRHNVGDVLAGVFVGSAMSAVFFAYQEANFQRAHETFYKQKRKRIVVVPDLQNRGVTLMTRW